MERLRRTVIMLSFLAVGCNTGSIESNFLSEESNIGESDNGIYLEKLIRPDRSIKIIDHNKEKYDLSVFSNKESRSLLLIVDKQLYSLDLNTKNFTQITYSKNDVIDFDYNGAENLLAVLYSDSLVVDDLPIKDWQSSYVGTSLDILRTDTGNIVQSSEYNPSDLVDDTDVPTFFSWTQKAIVFYGFDPNYPYSYIASNNGELKYINLKNNEEYIFPKFKGFPDKIMWSRNNIAINFMEYEGISGRVYDRNETSISQNIITKDDPFFSYLVGIDILGFDQNGRLVTAEFPGENFEIPPYIGKISYHDCNTAEVVKSYDVEYYSDYFMIGNDLYSTRDPFDTLSSTNSSSENESTSLLNRINFENKLVEKELDINKIPDDFKIFRNSYKKSDELNLWLISVYDENLEEFLMALDDATDIQLIISETSSSDVVFVD